jgi:hypothetical protein
MLRGLRAIKNIAIWHSFTFQFNVTLLPSFTDIEAFNQKLPVQSETDWNREHYKKLQTIGDLFEEDRKALLELPINSFNACRYERIKTDATVSFVLRGNIGTHRLRKWRKKNW